MSPPAPLTTPEAEAAAQRTAALDAAIHRAVLGQDELVEGIVATFLAGGHALLEGPPGVGKTLAALALSRAVAGSFGRVQFTPDLMPSDLTGHVVLDPQSWKTHVRKGPVFVNLLLADEINRAPARTQAALLEVMQEGQVTLEGEAHTLPPPFMVVATQNPLEQEGTYPLPEAQLDRFLVQLRIAYPPHADEAAIVRAATRGRVGDRLDVDAVEELMTLAEAADLRRQVSRVTVDDRVLDYAIRVNRATRGAPALSLGAGPRGGIAMVRLARAFALMEGRPYVVPDDVKRAALPALRHRVRVAPELEVEGRHADHALTELLAGVEAPRS